MSEKQADFTLLIGSLRNESQTLLKKKGISSIVIGLCKKHLLKILPSTEVVEAVVAPSNKKLNYYIYNVEEFNSLSPVSGFKDLYPGLREIDKITVDAKTLPQVLESFNKSVGAISQLILEQPEQSLDLLDSWQADGLLDYVEELWVRTSTFSLYKGMPTHKELVDWCSQNGFEAFKVIDAEDPEFFLQGFKRNVLYVPMKNFQNEVVKLKKEKAELNKSLEKAFKENQETQEKLNKNHELFLSRKQESEKRKEQLETLKSEHEEFKEKYQHLSELANERQQQIDELQKQNRKSKLSNQQLTERQNQLQNELIKTEAHVELIKELMING